MPDEKFLHGQICYTAEMWQASHLDLDMRRIRHETKTVVYIYFISPWINGLIYVYYCDAAYSSWADRERIRRIEYYKNEADAKSRTT